MDFSRFFIDRPIFAAVLVVIVIFAAGLITIPILPISEYPEGMRAYRSGAGRARSIRAPIPRSLPRPSPRRLKRRSTASKA